MALILHDYWRSGASYRVRIALNLKGLAYEAVAVDLRRGDQSAPGFRALNPQGLVPTLDTPDGRLTQSPAILEWLEERYPDPPLLPSDPFSRAVVRAMAALVSCDIHPLGNLRVLNQLRSQFGADDEAVRLWIARWITAGFDALETQVRAHGRGFCFGDRPTLADCCLAPQLYGARRFGVDLAPYPALRAVGDAMDRNAAFADAHPDRQPDADKGPAA